ncbi:hypothetical protein SAMN05421776_11825 [Nocardia farcinica]|uniref:HTH cro/C1-type domain-containing protein n=1 Tax=Nocardia farcinica TaxID=37329 RepID=A0A0H5NPI9_NOCFR|nr:helix-turn-helix transcriptional regulator [Nocardia farcinica]PFW98975.1 hypothetical protein CJ469_05711 [Nocardia farcinica]PFX05908.1 hypothetical protein CJ468_05119 [Nocardia farcinica]CRY77795.1 Uncharacterised protein [Nocardia farcinica]SIT33779.1 hypothetical protein SAMN05421776_11825 [Nocardia farcinica]
MQTEPTTWTVPALIAKNVARIRDVRRLTVRQLSERMTTIGAGMLPSAITNIEKGKRTVTVENLLCLAAALNASPADFLGADDRDLISVAPKLEPVKPVVLRGWMTDATPLHIRDGADYDDARSELLAAAPEWYRVAQERQQRTFRHPAMASLNTLRSFVVSAILDEETVEPALLAESLRTALEEVSGYVNLLANSLERKGSDD